MSVLCCQYSDHQDSSSTKECSLALSASAGDHSSLSGLGLPTLQMGFLGSCSFTDCVLEELK